MTALPAVDESTRRQRRQTLEVWARARAAQPGTRLKRVIDPVALTQRFEPAEGVAEEGIGITLVAPSDPDASLDVMAWARLIDRLDREYLGTGA